VRNPLIKATAGGFAAAIVAAAVVIPPASASSSAAVPFSQANFSGYATGTELHLGTTALNSLDQITGGNLSPITGLSINSLDQGFSAASTNTAGLTTPLTSELQTVIQPAQAATTKAFDEGAGLQLNLGGTTGATLNNLANTVLAAAKQAIPAPAIALAPPNIPGVTNQSALSLDPIANASSLLGQAQANFPTASCPTSDISYGLGNLTAANILTGLPTLTSSGVNSAPLISTAGDGTSVFLSKSLTSLVPNGDGTYGIQTQASDIIAPITFNLLGLATLEISVQSAGGVNDPVTLTATTSGEPSVPATVKMSTDDILTVKLTAAGQSTPAIDEQVPLSSVASNGKQIPLSISGISALLSQLTLPQLTTFLENTLNSLPSGSTLSSALNQVLGVLQPVVSPVESALNTVTPTLQQIISTLNGVINLNLGEIDIETVPHAIGGAFGSSPATTGGTAASGAFQLLNIKLGLTNSSINIPQQVVNQVNIPLTSIQLPDIALANPAVGVLEANSNQQQPISCATVQAQNNPTLPTPTTVPPKLPFTGGPGGLWQPVVGVGTLGLGGFSLALVRRLRRRSAA